VRRETIISFEEKKIQKMKQRKSMDLLNDGMAALHHNVVMRRLASRVPDPYSFDTDPDPAF
jgi:hypothetical protein